MKIIVFDNSRGKCYRKTRRHFSKILYRINHRIFVGDMPARCLKKMFFNLRTMVSKKSDILILIGEKEGVYGWAGYHFGMSRSKVKFSDLLKSNRYITI